MSIPLKLFVVLVAGFALRPATISCRDHRVWLLVWWLVCLAYTPYTVRAATLQLFGGQ